MILEKKEERNLTTYTHNGIKVATMYSTVQYNVRKYKVELHFSGNQVKIFYGAQAAEQHIINEFMHFVQRINGACERRFMYISHYHVCYMNNYIYESDWVDGILIVDLFNSNFTIDGKNWKEII